MGCQPDKEPVVVNKFDSIMDPSFNNSIGDPLDANYHKQGNEIIKFNALVQKVEIAEMDYYRDTCLD